MSIREQMDRILSEIENDAETQILGEDIRIDDEEICEFDVLPGARVAAVDGSSVIGGRHGEMRIGFIRAGYVIYDGERTGKNISEIEMLRIDDRTLLGTYEQKYLEIIGEEPPALRDLDTSYLLQRLRTLEEFRYMFLALDTLEEGDILLVDGALRGDKHTPDAGISLLSGMAQERGVSIVGISKDSSLIYKGLPLVPFVDSRAKGSFNGGRWYMKILRRRSPGREEIYVVRFNPYGEYAFRTDVISSGHVGEILGKVAWYASDPGYPGYPYPLADAHNEVVIHRGFAEEIVNMLQMDIGLPGSFHAMLDGGV